MKRRLNGIFLGIACGLLTVMALPSEAQCAERKGDHPFESGSFKMGMYGFVKMDVHYEDRITGGIEGVFPNAVPDNNDRCRKHSQLQLDARYSRIGFWAKKTVCCWTTKAKFEMDFFTNEGNAKSTNSRHMRLRHVFAEAKHPCGMFFLGGQTWSMRDWYREWGAMPTANQAATPVGTPKNRVPQVRLGYTYKNCVWDSDIKLEANIEKFGFEDGFLNSPVAAEFGPELNGRQQPFPLFNAKASWLTKNFKWQFVVSGTRATFVKGNDCQECCDDADCAEEGSELCHNGRSKEGIWRVGSNAYFKWCDLTLMGTGFYSKGIQRANSAYLDDFGLRCNSLWPGKSAGGTFLVRWDFCPKVLWVDLIYGFEKILSNRGQVDECDIIDSDQVFCNENTGTRFPGERYRRFSDFRANVFYTLWKHWTFGLEYGRFDHKKFNGDKGHVNIGYFTMIYKFGKS